MIWNEKFETMSRGEMRDWQGRKLGEMVERIYHNVSFYRRKMQERDILPGDIRSVDDLKNLPFTTKDDLRDNYPYGLFAAPMSEVVRVHASSGTTGKPTVVGYTRRDISIWSEVVARMLCSAGVNRNDYIQVAYGYGLFTGGLGIHYGSEKVGATVIPISGGNTRRQIQLMKDFGSSVLACTPSYALYLAELIEDLKIDRDKLKLRVGVFGAEPWTDNMRGIVEERLNIKAIDIYGLSEIIGPGVSSECEYQDGLHVNEDHFIPEIIDPDNLEVLAAGEQGELVFTTISKEGFPLLRYRTRDLSRLNYEQCRCGRNLVRMEKCLARSDDMLVIRGVNVFPSQVESVLLEMGEIEPHYQLIVERENNLDILEVQVEVEGQFFSDEVKKLESLRNKIKNNLESTIGLSVRVKLVEPRTIERTEGKSKRVIDKRLS